MIIALHGPKQSGKDYFYQTVQQHFPHLPIEKIAFADFLKKQLMIILQLNNEQEYDLFKTQNISFNLFGEDRVVSGRHLVREIGMMIRRLRPEIFNEDVKNRIQSQPDKIWIITDLRFSDESDLIQQMGGVLVKIRRLGFSYDGHITETELSDTRFNFNLNNFGSIQLYQDNILTLFNEILNNYRYIKEV